MGLFNRHHHEWVTISAKNMVRVSSRYLSDAEEIAVVSGRTDIPTQVKQDYTSVAQRCQGCGKIKSYTIEGCHAEQILAAK